MSVAFLVLKGVKHQFLPTLPAKDRQCGLCGRSFPTNANKLCRAIQRFESANNVVTCTVFSANLRNHTYVKYYNAMLRRCNHPVPHACRPRP